jgi:hypothetical protein
MVGFSIEVRPLNEIHPDKTGLYYQTVILASSFKKIALIICGEFNYITLPYILVA